MLWHPVVVLKGKVHLFSIAIPSHWGGKAPELPIISIDIIWLAVVAPRFSSPPGNSRPLFFRDGIHVVKFSYSSRVIVNNSFNLFLNKSLSINLVSYWLIMVGEVLLFNEISTIFSSFVLHIIIPTLEFS